MVLTYFELITLSHERITNNEKYYLRKKLMEKIIFQKLQRKFLIENTDNNELNYNVF